MDMTIPTNLTCVLFDPAIPTSSFNFIFFIFCTYIRILHQNTKTGKWAPSKEKLSLGVENPWVPHLLNKSPIITDLILVENKVSWELVFSVLVG